MTKEDINNRVIQAIEHLLSNNLVANKTELADAFNIKPTKFSEILNKRMNAGTDIISILCDRYNVSPSWLLNGRGDMITDCFKTSAAVPVQAGHGIPLIPTYGMCGYGTPAFDDLPVEGYYSVPEFSGAEFLLRLLGDSMQPRFFAGDVVACRMVREILFFQWNKIYAIYSVSQGLLVKHVKPSDTDGSVRLVSENPDYSPFDIPLSDIRALALVIGVIHLE